MVVGQYDVRLNGDRMLILTQTNTFSLQEEVTITSPDVLVHNHPSGSVAASKDDFSVFRKLVMASEMMGMQFLDFIIIGKGYCSFKEYGYFEK